MNRGIFSKMSYQEGLREQVVVRGTIGSGKKLLEQPGSCNAFFGISLNKSISDRHLTMYVQWLVDHCRHCPVLIDDIEFRHNYIVFDGMDEAQATNTALHRGLQLATRIAGIVASATYPYKGDRRVDPDDHRGHGIWVNRSSDEFFGFLKVRLGFLTEAYTKDNTFRDDVDAQVERSMKKRLAPWREQAGEVVYQIGRAQLAKFVLEETAVTIDQVERGYAIELYAGDPIQVMVDLYDPQTNKYPKLREALNVQGQYGHISLGIEWTPQR